MGISVGQSSYIAWGMQTAFRTPQTTLVTGAHLRTGSIFASRQSNMDRLSTVALMPRASQTWRTMGLVDFEAGFEYVANDTAFLQLMTAAWGHRFLAAGSPDVNTYLMRNPHVNEASVPDTATDFYNYGLTVRQILSDGTTVQDVYTVSDITINRFVLTMEANESLKFSVTGVGQNMIATDTAPSFVDITGTTLAWNHAIASGNSGLYLDSAGGAPTTPFLAKKVELTLDHNLLFDPFLGAASGQEMKLPTRAGFPSATISVEMDYEDATSGTDAVALMTAYIANTKENFRAEYWLSGTESLELLSSGATPVNIIDNPRPIYNGEGKVGFAFNLLVKPEVSASTTADNFKLIQNAT